MLRRCFITLAVITAIILTGIVVADNFRDDRLQAKIDTDFMSSYNELILGMLNRSIQYDEFVIHKYDTANTKYGQTIIALYPYNSYINHQRFYDIVQLLDQSSGCDAWYDINMDKELYDRLNELGKAIFSKPQVVTEEILENTYTFLSDSISFVPKGRPVKNKVRFYERTAGQNPIDIQVEGRYEIPAEFTATFPFFEDKKPESVVAVFTPQESLDKVEESVIAVLRAPFVYQTMAEVLSMEINLPPDVKEGLLWFEYSYTDGSTEKSDIYRIYKKQ